MVWFKVDDSLPFHAKVVQAGNPAMGLWVRAGAWAAQQLTDGFIPDHIVTTLGSTAQAKRLVEADLWIRTDGGYRFHQWNEDGRQPTRASVEKERAEAKARMRKAREEKKNAHANGGRTLSTNETSPSTEQRPDAGDEEDAQVNGKCSPELRQNFRANTGRSSGGVRSTRPDPTRPDPTRPLEQDNFGGDVASVDASVPPPLYPDHCPDHAYDAVPPKCGGCQKQKQANQARAETLPDYRLRVVPPLCGQCDERWIETPAGLAKCPRCYPADREAAS